MTTTIETSTIYYAVPVVILEDAPQHTEANGFVCDDPTCPCREEFEDAIDDNYPSESEIEAMYAGYNKRHWLSEHL